MEKVVNGSGDIDNLYKDFSAQFEPGLKLVRDKTGKNRFFITQKALRDPDKFIADLIKNRLSRSDGKGPSAEK